jgi:hypothetical protein
MKAPFVARGRTTLTCAATRAHFTGPRGLSGHGSRIGRRGPGSDRTVSSRPGGLRHPIAWDFRDQIVFHSSGTTAHGGASHSPFDRSQPCPGKSSGTGNRRGRLPYQTLRPPGSSWPVFRRSCGGSREPSSPVDVLERGGVRIDLAGREVTADGRPISLRKKEYELLVYLIRHGGEDPSHANESTERSGETK